MLKSIFDTKFLYYSRDSSKLKTIAEILKAHNEINLRVKTPELDNWERDIVPYEYGSLFSSITTLEANSPEHSDTGNIPSKIRIPQGKIAFLNSSYDLYSQPCQDLIGFISYLYTNLPERPDIVLSTAPWFEDMSQPITKPNTSEPKYPRSYITWLDIYTPQEIKYIGRERLLSVPAPITKVLDDDSILLASQHPLANTTNELQKVSSHLNIPIAPQYRDS